MKTDLRGVLLVKNGIDVEGAKISMDEYAIEFAQWLRLAEWQNRTKTLFKDGNYARLLIIFKQSLLDKQL